MTSVRAALLLLCGNAVPLMSEDAGIRCRTPGGGHLGSGPEKPDPLSTTSKVTTHLEVNTWTPVSCWS